MKRIFANLLSISFIMLVLYNCKDEPPVVPPPPSPPPNVKDTLTLTFEYATHRSVIINAKSTTNNKNSIIQLYRQFNNADTLVAEYAITTNDTSIIDDNNGNGLQLNTTYTYYAVRIDTLDERKDSSNFITAKTLSATGFNYTWQEFALGEPGSVLYDVWGTDENNIYACGTIMINDTTAYGVIKWNGFEWLLEKEIGGLRAIFGFSNSDIWTVGGGVWHYNGTEWEEYTYRHPVITNNISYSNLWGTSSNSIYFGNTGGKIIHWDGTNASIVYTNPDIVQVSDLDGYSAAFIIGVGMGFTPPLLAVYYNGIRWNRLPLENDPSLNSVEIVSTNHIYFGGDGIFEMKGNSFSRILSPGYYVSDIEYNRQTGVTVASGHFGGVYIHNGLEWRNFQGQITTDDNDFVGIFLINNIIFCVGRNNTRAKIIIGTN